MFGKTVYLLAFLVSVAVVANAEPGFFRSYNAKNGSHHLIVGSRVPGDRLVLKQPVYRRSVWNQVISVQQVFNASRYERITLVRAIDQMTNGRGAWPALLNGGPGRNNVTLRFTSLKGEGINFSVELYARP